MAVPSLFETAFASYKRHSQLGAGGSGLAFRVSTEGGMDFALKVLKPESASSRKLKRFRNEVQFCSSTEAEHKNIIKVLDWGFSTIDGVKCPFYVMKLYPRTFRALKTFSDKERMSAFLKVLDGVEAAHLHSVWHRDLKPENILLGDNADDVVVADFGVAHFHEDFLATRVETQPAERLANFQYAAPEQRRQGGNVNHLSDIYSLGLILNELFTGQVPQGSNFARVGSKSPEFAFLDPIVDLMTRQDPNERPSSIEALKSLISIKGNNFVSQQRLSSIEKRVVPKFSVDDPLVSTPPRIVEFDYHPGRLTMKLDQPVSHSWRGIFQGLQNYRSCMWGKDPSSYAIGEQSLSISASENEAQEALDQSKRFVSLANESYANFVAQQMEKQRVAAENDLAAERRREAERARVLGSLKL